MKCSSCGDQVKAFDSRRRQLSHRLLPYCEHCRRYRFTWPYVLVLSALCVGGFLLASWVIQAIA